MPATLTSSSDRKSLLWAVIIAFASFLILIIQWQFCRLTGSVLVLGQALLHWVAAVILLAFWFQPFQKWRLVTQLLVSSVVVLLCGLVLNETYISWVENRRVLTADALPVVLIGYGGLYLLSRLVLRMGRTRCEGFEYAVAGRFGPLFSALLAAVLVLTHLTGWFWLDLAAGVVTAGLLGVVALFVLLDGYWKILEKQW